MSDSRQLIPILREGIDIIKMVFFQKLRSYLSGKHPDSDPAYINKLAGAIINALFGTLNEDEPFATFANENRARIEEEMRGLSIHFQEMRIPITDALRIQFLCDHQDGIDSSSVLARAKELGILIVDRDVPLPASFMNLVRRLGSASDILVRP